MEVLSHLLLMNCLPIDIVFDGGNGYHSFPRLEFVDAQSAGLQNGSGASGQVVLEEEKFRLLK